MSVRGFLALFIVTAIALVAAIALVVSEQIAASDDRRAGGLFFPDLSGRVADVSQVTINAARYDLVAERRDDGWVAVDRGGYPVRSEPLDQLLAGMAELVEYERKTTNPELYRILGVEGPSSDREDTLVEVRSADGEVLANAILGFPANAIGQDTRGGMYIRRVDEERVWLAEGTVLPPTFTAEFFDQLFSVSGREVGRVTFFEGDTMVFDALKVDYDTSDYELEYLDPAYGPEDTLANDSGVRGLSQAIVSTTFVDARPADEFTVPEGARTVRFVTQGGMSLAITLGEIDGETWVTYDVAAEPGSEAEAQAEQIRAATEGWAFQLQPGRIITLSRPIEDLIELPAPAPAPQAPAEEAPAGPLLPL